jgi:hypothetical protein
METEAVAAKKGQKTIPTRLCKKSTIDLAGSGVKHATPEEMKRLLDKLRKEDV